MTPQFEPSPELLDAALELVAADGRRAVFPVVGTSMTPTLREGDAVLVELNPPSLRRGDLVVFRSREGLVVHRCVEMPHARKGTAMRCRGDGRELLDPPVASEAVRGRAVALRRGGCWWNLEPPPARAYARAAAFHDRFWAGVHRRAIARARRITGGVDRGLLRLADRFLFRAFHRRLPPPAGAPSPR